MDTSAQLIARIRTRQEANEIQDALDTFLANLFVTKKSQEPFANLSPEIASFLKQHLTKDQTAQNMKNRTAQLQEKLQSCKTVYVTLAFTPSESLINTVSSYIKKGLGDDTLLDIKIDKNILGGAILIVNGLYRDYSLKKKLMTVFEKQREEIQRLLV